MKDVLVSGIEDGTTPGAAAFVMERDVVHHWCAGTLHRERGARAVNEDTVWDLASLTKLLSTTLLAARAIDDSKLALDETPWPHWPGVTVEHVLRHESGLPAWRPLFEEARKAGRAGLPEGKRIVVNAALAVELEAPPLQRTRYSDIGFIALGALLEQRFAAGLNEVFADEARRRFGATTLRFVRLDVDGFHPAVPTVAPTERCPWRRRTVHGQVHDENAFAMGGVAGHAGLFGTLRDVEACARFFLGEMTPTLRSFAAATPPPRRPIGFDHATGGASTGGALPSSSVGHLGFTGVSLWADRENARAYALLTNRIHDTREGGAEKILALRRRFHVEASRQAGGTPAPPLS